MPIYGINNLQGDIYTTTGRKIKSENGPAASSLKCSMFTYYRD
jgi:hypothetical protein